MKKGEIKVYVSNYGKGGFNLFTSIIKILYPFFVIIMNMILCEKT